MKDASALIFARETRFPPIDRRGMSTLQVNLGYRCNLSCVHCHVNAGPSRTEQMDDDTIALVIEVLERCRPRTLDLTGGAPEMHSRFRDLVIAARRLGVDVIDRCNLTILLEPGHEDLADFLASQRVRVVASLPCYQQDNVEKQRGKGVFDGSIEALRRLNALGYGDDAGLLALDLVYNPVGAHLPPEQAALEADYKRELHERFGLRFNQLLTITNMPISRFGAVLMAQNQFDDYMSLLMAAHRDGNLEHVMCRDTVSVDFRGQLYDCDFNQMLALPLMAEGRRRHLRDLLDSTLPGNSIQVADHCFGCTAGAGSSCGGALG